MEALQAAVLRVKLKRLPQWNARRREIARLYRDLLECARLQMPVDDPANECVYHQFAVYVDDRDRVRSELEARGVSTAVYYPMPIHQQAAYAGLEYPARSVSYSERACERVLCLPLFPELADPEVEYAAHLLVEVVGRTG